MRIIIAGGHGRIGLRLERLLADRGDTAVGLVRDPAQADDLRDAGAGAAVFDLEQGTAAGLAEVLAGADAVVFAAGAGPGSGAARKDTVDRGAAVLLADAAELAGIGRYLMVSSLGAAEEPPPDAEPVFAAYLRAKHAADEDLRRRALDWTILRPGGLTEAPGSGRVELRPEPSTGRSASGRVPREDVAAVLVALLDESRTAGHVLTLVAGATPIAEAVSAIVG